MQERNQEIETLIFLGFSGTFCEKKDKEQ
uniref:Uncharacterized protein n=1 Tax=Rhizophora mucronata TaxID=61149 RepID=A0A2P2P3U4_RHIMU